VVKFQTTNLDYEKRHRRCDVRYSTVTDGIEPPYPSMLEYIYASRKSYTSTVVHVGIPKNSHSSHTIGRNFLYSTTYGTVSPRRQASDMRWPLEILRFFTFVLLWRGRKQSKLRLRTPFFVSRRTKVTSTSRGTPSKAHLFDSEKDMKHFLIMTLSVFWRSSSNGTNKRSCHAFVTKHSPRSHSHIPTKTMGAPLQEKEKHSSVREEGESLPIVAGIRDIVDRYDVFLLDMWGLMHDGSVAYPGVVETVQQLRKAGKELIILSNSSKRKEKSVKSLQRLGFDPTDFSQIITSGEVTYQLLANASPEESALAPNPWDVLADVWRKDTKNVFCFGSGEGDEEYFALCGWTLSSMEDADVIVARGTFSINDGTTVVVKSKDGEEAYRRTYQEQLKKAAARRIPMIIANPDKVRPDKDRSPMPGTIGMDYEQLLRMAGCDDVPSFIKYVGKPFSDVYDIALRGKKKEDRSRVCMVGDALETDVTGGSAFGIDTIWVVMNGIHNAAVEVEGSGDFHDGCKKVLKKFNQGSGTSYAKGRKLNPSVVLSHFRW